MKIKKLLEENKDNINEIYLVLSSILNMEIPRIKLNKDLELTKNEYRKYKKIEKKLKKMPVQYALKNANFYGIDFYVDKNVLIPRPETEYLVQETSKLINKKFNNKKIKVIDIGTGSGIIAITLKKLNANIKIIGTDISKKALKVAKKNNKIHNTKVEFKKSDLYEKICDKYDVVISNPPYIDKNSTSIQYKVKKYEPNVALFSSEQGTYYYRKILENINNIINKNHIIAFEIGENQSEIIIKLIKEYLKNDEIIIKKDYNGFDRYIFIVSK